MLPANQLLSAIELVSKPKKKSTEIVFFLDYGHLALYNRDSGVILKIKLPRDIPDFTSFYARADLLIEYLKTAKKHPC